MSKRLERTGLHVLDLGDSGWHSLINQDFHQLDEGLFCHVFTHQAAADVTVGLAVQFADGLIKRGPGPQVLGVVVDVTDGEATVALLGEVVVPVAGGDGRYAYALPDGSAYLATIDELATAPPGSFLGVLLWRGEDGKATIALGNMGKLGAIMHQSPCRADTLGESGHADDRLTLSVLCAAITVTGSPPEVRFSAAHMGHGNVGFSDVTRIGEDVFKLTLAQPHAAPPIVSAQSSTPRTRVATAATTTAISLQVTDLTGTPVDLNTFTGLITVMAEGVF